MTEPQRLIFDGTLDQIAADVGAHTVVEIANACDTLANQSRNQGPHGAWFAERLDEIGQYVADWCGTHAWLQQQHENSVLAHLDQQFEGGAIDDGTGTGDGTTGEGHTDGGNPR